MSPAFSKLKAHLATWREWELNPVVIKELRQSVRSWAVTGMLLLFLGIMFIAALIFLITQSFDNNTNQYLGSQIFHTFVVILTGASLVFIPLYVGIRLAAERQESNLDLLYISTLTPERIIRGKFLCGAYMAVLFFSACMPFMVFTNLLRGIDLPTIGFILICLFLAVCAAIQGAIFVACLPISRTFKILVSLIGLGYLVPGIFALVFFFFEMVGSGVGSMMTGADFWVGFLTSSSVVLGGVVLLYFISVALISPLSTNRALPLRACVTALWIIGALVCGFWTWKQHDARLMLPWAITSFVLLSISMIVIVSNQDQLSFRVRRKIPAPPVQRACAFLFYNGAAGGMVWVASLLGITFLVTSALLHGSPQWFSKTPFSTMSASDLYGFDIMTGATLLYGFDYALTALLIHRRFFNRRPPRLAGVFAVLLPGAWALLPNIFFFFLNQLSWKSLEKVQLGNLFNIFSVKDESQQRLHLYFAAGWLLLMLVLNGKWFMCQLANFQPLQKYVEPPPVITQAPPVISSLP